MCDYQSISQINDTLLKFRLILDFDQGTNTFNVHGRAQQKNNSFQSARVLRHKSHSIGKCW